MKKIIMIKAVLMLVSVGLLAGCGEMGGEGNVSTGSANGNSMDGAMYKLARMNGCIDCHRLNATVMGPSWQAVAERYRDAPFESVREMLIERVKKGSKGNWITWKAPDGMPPMERRVSSEHIETLVEYIISLNRAPGVDSAVEHTSQ